MACSILGNSSDYYCTDLDLYQQRRHQDNNLVRYVANSSYVGNGNPVSFIAKQMDLSFAQMVQTIRDSGIAYLVFDDWNDKRHFVKQFFSGVFITIVMTSWAGYDAKEPEFVGTLAMPKKTCIGTDLPSCRLTLFSFPLAYCCSFCA